jgi:hypothetical protein
MKKLILLGLVSMFVLASSAMARGIPPDAKTHLELDCVAHLDGQYAGVQNVVIRDVTYITPPAPWENNNSAMDVSLPDGSVIEGAMNESNGNDPQDYRDSAPSEYSGSGGLTMYAFTSVNGKDLVFVTQSLTNQRGLSNRTYTVRVLILDENTGNAVGGPLSTGQLVCQVRS